MFKVERETTTSSVKLKVFEGILMFSVDPNLPKRRCRIIVKTLEAQANYITSALW